MMKGHEVHSSSVGSAVTGLHCIGLNERRFCALPNCLVIHQPD